MSIEDHKVLKTGARWQDLRLYKKSDTLYQFTVVFCHRFLPPYGDRTVDQMVQAARSGKQNIVEGSEDGKTSTEMELKLINVARASIGELREDYKDYLVAHNLSVWDASQTQYKDIQAFTKTYLEWKDYEAHSKQWSDEEMGNIGLTLCYQMDTMLNRYLKQLQERFVSEGGIKERMYAARTGYRKEQEERLKQLEQENAQLKQQLDAALATNRQWQAAYEELKQRAITKINELQQKLDSDG